MGNETYLILAYGISFVVFAIYLWSLYSTSKNLNEDVQSLRDEMKNEG